MLRQSTFTKNIALFLAALLFFTSCTSTTTIMSRPPGAKVFLNGEYIGETPVNYSDTKIVGSANHVVLEKEGYENLVTSFSRDEEADVGAIIGGLFFLFPFLWTMKYKASRTYDLIQVGVSSEPAPTRMTPKPIETQIKNPNSLTPKTDQLRELKKLMDEGIITKEEFEAEKKKILNQDE